MPDKPDAYKVELPKDFTPPPGVEYKFNDTDPLLAQARTLAHESGLSQEQFSKFLGLYAGAQVADEQMIATARAAEIAKLGPTITARIDALHTFFKAYLGEAEGNRAMSYTTTANDVQILEKLVAKITNQGGASFRTNGREPPAQPGRVSAEDYARMTPSQRWDYSRSFDQKQFQTVPGGRQ